MFSEAQNSFDSDWKKKTHTTQNSFLRMVLAASVFFNKQLRQALGNKWFLIKVK